VKKIQPGKIRQSKGHKNPTGELLESLSHWLPMPSGHLILRQLLAASERQLLQEDCYDLWGY